MYLLILFFLILITMCKQTHSLPTALGADLRLSPHFLNTTSEIRSVWFATSAGFLCPAYSRYLFSLRFETNMNQHACIKFWMLSHQIVAGLTNITTHQNVTSEFIRMLLIILWTGGCGLVGVSIFAKASKHLLIVSS